MRITIKRALRQRRIQIDRMLGVIAIVIILATWVVGGSLAEKRILPSLKLAVPEADQFIQINATTYEAIRVESVDTLIAYVTLAEAMGYGGPLKVAVATNLDGDVVGMSIADHKETPSYLDRVLKTNFVTLLLGKSYRDAYSDEQDIDLISGATYTTLAIAEGVKSGSRRIAVGQLAFDNPTEEATKIQFGIPEITLAALYFVGFIGHKHSFKYTKIARWVSLLVGLFVLGFMFNRPLTIATINQLLLGYIPQWQTNFYWFMLLGGILFVFVVDNKNPYCEWFCPFGAAQDCLGAIGGAKNVSPGRYRVFLLWLQRGLAWAAIVLALYFRNPGLTSFEVFGTLFNLTGSAIQFAVLSIILMISLFIKRPWCAYLCPLRPVMDLYRVFRRWIMDQWRRQIQKKTA